MGQRLVQQVNSTTYSFRGHRQVAKLPGACCLWLFEGRKQVLMKNCFKDGKLKNVLFSLALVAKCDLYVVFITCLIHSMAINDDT